MRKRQALGWLLLACFLLGALIACDQTDQPSESHTPETTVTEAVANTDEVTDRETIPETEVSAETNSSHEGNTEPHEPEPETDTSETVETAETESQPAEIESETSEPPHTHAWSDWETVKEATCTENGNRERACTCGETEQASIDAAGHTPGEIASCTQSQKCTVCNAVLVDALGHTAGDWGVDTEAACEIKGSKHKDCSVCGVTVETGDIPATGHTEVIDTGKEATCLSSGISDGKHCSVCGLVLVEQTRVPAKGHTETTVWGKDATCTQTGLTDGKACSVCGVVTVTQTEIPATGHTEVIDRATEATCTEAGQSEGKHCSVCGEVTVAPSTTPAKGHTDAIIPAIKATCTKEGATEGVKCSVCGEITVPQTVLPAKGHTEILDAAKAPTCTKTGLTQGSHCSTCGQVAVAQKIVPAKGHTEITVAGKPATCTQNGITEGKKCATCGEIMIAQTVLLSPGHQAVVIPKVEATCAATGLTEGSYCGVCEVILVAQEKIFSPDHIFEDGKCKDCGCDRISQGLTYSLNSDQKSYTVTGMGTCTDTELIIPASYQDLPVTAINASAFANYAVLSVIVPDSVTSIGSGAFKGCNNLEEITLPFIGRSMGATGSEGVFGHIFGYTSLSSSYHNTKTSQGKGYTHQYTYSSNSQYCYYIPETLRKVTITLDTTIPEGALRNCDLIEEITLPDGIESINQYAFYNCTALKTVDAGVDAIQTIGSYAFTNCVSLIRIGDVEKVIELPGTLQNLGDYAFRNCVNFETLDLHLVGSIGNYAFDGCTGVKEVTLGDQITYIGSSAFMNCIFTEIDLPDALTYIGSSAFANCPASELTIPNSVTEIGNYAFQNWLITSVIVPDGVMSIGVGAFKGCNNLEEITLPFIGRSMGATGSEGVFGYIFDYTILSSSYQNTTTSKGQGCTYQYYSSSNYYCYYIPETLRKVTITLDTTIPNDAFRNCDVIEEITLPEEIEKIENYTFYNCTSLKNLRFRDDTTPAPMQRKAPVALFAAGVNAGGTLLRIGDYAFYNCSSMPSFDEDISGLTYLGQYAFYNCAALTRLGSTDKVIALPETLTNVGGYAFYNCGQFEKLILNLKGQIGDYAFDQCTAVTSVTLGKDITYIGNGAFRLCQASILALPQGLTYIGSQAFMDWMMTEVTIPDGVTYIGSGAFNGCDYIEQMTLPFVGREDNGQYPFGDIFGSVTGSSQVKTSAWLGYTYQGKYYYAIPNTLRRVTVTKGTNISAYAFYNCDLLEVIALPKTVQSIGGYAVANCTDLTHLYFGGSRSDWRDISLSASWDSGTDYYYLHMYADEYGLYLPTGAIRLQVASDNTFLLLPLDGTVEAQAYHVRTHNLVSLEEAGMSLQVVRNDYKLSVTGRDNISTSSRGGVAALQVFRNMGQIDVIMDSSLNVFIAECGLYDSMAKPVFSLDEKEYIVFSMDFVMSMNDTSDPYTEIDFEFKYYEQLLYNASHITDYISGILQGDTRDMTVIKQTLAKFIQNYVESDYAHKKAVEDTEIIVAGFESANELVKKYKNFDNFKKAFNVTREGWSMLVNLSEYYELYKLQGITTEELKNVAKLLSELENYDDMDEAFRSAKRWHDFTEKTRQSFDSLTDASERFNKALDMEVEDLKGNSKNLAELLSGGGKITSFEDISPDWGDVLEVGLDAIIYMLHDYYYNINVLETLRDNFKDKSTTEYRAVCELISEYEHKEFSCIQDIVMRFGSITIVNIAKKNPVVSLTLLAADILKVLNPVNEKKVEFMILDTLRTPLASAIWPAKDLFHNGVITADLDELKTLTCIYLHLMKEYNELAIYITTRESTDEDYIEDAYALNYNISKIESLLRTYY